MSFIIHGVYRWDITGALSPLPPKRRLYGGAAVETCPLKRSILIIGKCQRARRSRWPRGHFSPVVFFLLFFSLSRSVRPTRFKLKKKRLKPWNEWLHDLICINRGRRLYKTEVKREATLVGDVPARPQFISAEGRDFQLGLDVCAEDVKNEGFDFCHTGKQFFFLREQNRKRPFVPTLFCPQVTIAKLYPAKEKESCWWRGGAGSRGEGGEIEIEMKRANGWEFTSMIKAHRRVLKAAPLLEVPPPWW